MGRPFSPSDLDQLRTLVTKHGLTAAAELMKVRYSRVRDAAIGLGFEVKRGRRASAATRQRDARIVELRKRDMALAAIGQKFGISAERVRQIVESNERQSQGQTTASTAAASAVAPVPAKLTQS